MNVLVEKPKLVISQASIGEELANRLENERLSVIFNIAYRAVSENIDYQDQAGKRGAGAPKPAWSGSII